MLHAFRRLPLPIHAALLLAGVAVPHVRAQEVYGPPAVDAVPPNLPPPATIPAELDRAATLAVTTHPIVNAAEAESEALDAELRGARWLRYPNLGVEALAATRGSNFADRDGLTANIVAEQPLWSGGRIDGEIESAAATARAGRQRIGEASRQITIDVITAYYQQVLGEERIGVLNDSLEQHRVLVGSIERRVAQEVSPQVDLTLARSRVAQIELELAAAEELQARSRARLLQLTGGVPVAPVLPPPVATEALPPLDQAVGDGLQCSPTLQALLSQVDAAEARRRVARGELLPQVLIQLSQNELIGARAALVVRADTGSGLSRLAAIDSAEARIARAFAEFGEAERNLREQLQTDYVQLRAAQDRIASGSFAADTAADLIESYQRQFIAGRRSWLDVMNATREAASARLSESEARVTAAAAAARILALSCRWGPMPTGGTE